MNFTFHLSIHIHIDYLDVFNHSIDQFLFFLLQFSFFISSHSFFLFNFSCSHSVIFNFGSSSTHSIHSITLFSFLLTRASSISMLFTWFIGSLEPLFFLFEVKSMLMSHWVTIQKSLECCMLYYRLFCFFFLFFFLFSYSFMLKSCRVSYWLCIRTSLILSSLPTWCWILKLWLLSSDLIFLSSFCSTHYFPFWINHVTHPSFASIQPHLLTWLLILQLEDEKWNKEKGKKKKFLNNKLFYISLILHLVLYSFFYSFFYSWFFHLFISHQNNCWMIVYVT